MSISIDTDTDSSEQTLFAEYIAFAPGFRFFRPPRIVVLGLKDEMPRVRTDDANGDIKKEAVSSKIPYRGLL